ncbi:CaiB/BaiF CoA transferase family protein [Gordonia rhizosphera]|uniref:Putative fatty acid-CoA racemase n=1 Tax=Gordonia rhizosphera NBRC 16068 TaxID=1108045 RepID=K6WFL6_9ACTN|nr:CaiB/BaiF CoA-transferase family protein [Gordonia rhizosphera]GAB92566.1 putative fatty acid-CoA racemase [Gordonia rhizosphera NBRC 16068]
MTGPLHGVRVLVLAGMGPVPYVSMLLADMGAHVVRVIRPPHRSARALSQTDALRDDADPVNRHVDSIAVDLKDPAGVEQVIDLARAADVFIEGYRPGVVERLGLGPEVLRKQNSRLIYVRMTGYGQTGPLAHDAGHDINYVAQTGALHAMARHGEAPRPPINLLGDYAGGGMTAAYGIACALVEARTSGEGQVIDAAMIDGVALLTAKLQGLRAAGLYSDDPGTNFLDSGAPFYDTYRCADGGYIAVGALEPDFYREFISRLGVDTSDWPEQNDRRGWNRLREVIADSVKQRPRDEWARIYEGTDSCVTPVLTFDEAAVSPHNLARNMYGTVDGVLHSAPAPRLSRTPARGPARPPLGLRSADDVAADWGHADVPVPY